MAGPLGRTTSYVRRPAVFKRLFVAPAEPPHGVNGFMERPPPDPVFHSPHTPVCQRQSRCLLGGKRTHTLGESLNISPCTAGRMFNLKTLLCELGKLTQQISHGVSSGVRPIPNPPKGRKIVQCLCTIAPFLPMSRLLYGQGPRST